MATTPIAIVGVGMISAVGLSAPELAASVRARTVRFATIGLLDRGFDSYTVAEVPNDGLPPLVGALQADRRLTMREQRLLRLASAALEECCRGVDTNAIGPALTIALPEHETAIPLSEHAFLRSLLQQVPWLAPRLASATLRGRAGGLRAIGHAVTIIRSGYADVVVAGGIDSFIDPYVLSTLDAAQRIKSEEAMDFFVPGEGAGFLLLTRADLAAQRGFTILATLSDAGLGFEPGHLHSETPYRGSGLADSLRELVARDDVPAPIAEVFSSMNGESHWAKEWGVSYTRNCAAFHANHRMHHPADCFGDTGAACGPMMTGLAALGIHGRYLRAPALVYASSDRGERAALIVSSA